MDSDYHIEAIHHHTEGGKEENVKQSVNTVNAFADSSCLVNKECKEDDIIDSR